MLDAWIIEEIRRKEREQEERDRPRLQLPIPEYLPPHQKKNEEEIPWQIEISYEQEEPRSPGEVNFEIKEYQM